MQVNVQFLQQLQPEWSRFVTVVKQSKEIDTISYHTLFDILKQYQNEVNDIRAERIAKSKEIAKPVTPPSESVSKEDSDPEQAQRDKDMQKNLTLLAKYFRQFGNQRTMTVAGARETVGSQVVQQNGIQCFICKGFVHYAKECQEAKAGFKDYTYHTRKEVLPEESSSTEQPLEQVQNHDEKKCFANERRHASNLKPLIHYVLEKDDNNVTPDSSNICNNDNQVDQNAAEYVDERAALANLIANLTLDTEENRNF
ncbi:hypothetical protein Tco_0257616 [Tanacetum coccineum]